MSAKHLDRIFQPRRIAVIGTSPTAAGLMGTVLRNLIGAGFDGVVYPVVPGCESVLGIPCFSGLEDLPKTPDLGLICAPAAQVPELVRDCGQAGLLGLIIISSGFREIGAEGQALEERIRAEAGRFDGMRIIGPNCLGVIVPRLRLNATFAQGMPRAGHVAFVSQSGALCGAVLDWALAEGIGFSHFVSIGNCLDVDFGDLIDYLGEDEDTRSIILYVESIGRARRFMSAARAFARTKPILAFKAGRFPESAAAAASHTGALASEDAVYGAAFQRAGIARVFDIGEIFDCAELIGRHKMPTGARLGIVTNAGGPGVIATDALLESHGVLAQLSSETRAELDRSLPRFGTHDNPVDVLGDARPRRFAKGVELVLADPGVDAVLAILTPQGMTRPTTVAKRLASLAEKSAKPILAAWLGGESMREGIQVLNQAGVATYRTPEQAVRAFMTLVGYARNLETLYETPRDIPVELELDRRALRERFVELLPEAGEIFSETASKALLAAYGIPVAEAREAGSGEQAVALAEEIGYPVVLKLLSPEITHKTDVGGVALNLRDAAMVQSAYEEIVANARARCPQARLDGVTVQPMVTADGGVELILGSKRDAVFGAVLLTGLGGTAAELFGDRALGFPPLNERLARRMLESLRAWPLLAGYRGRPRVHLDRLIEILIRLSYLVADHPEIEALDVNPLLATPEEVVALDARVIIDRSRRGQKTRPYAHLALRPYPDELVASATLRDGTEITLRPIKPEDEPLWLELLASCSQESIYSRFRYFFHWSTHETASRYCFIDYDRELAMVAEVEGARKLLAVGRLVADPDHEVAEYAVLVADAWQGKGLGGMLTESCARIAAGWGVRRLVAETTRDNPRMLAILRQRGFELSSDPGDSLIKDSKELESNSS